MEILSNTIIATICVAIMLVYTWRVLNWAWFRPKKLENILRQRGLKGNPYKLLYGDLNEFTKSIVEAKSKPINFSDDIAQRLIPFFLNSINKNGPYPTVLITDPEHVKEIFTKNYVYVKQRHANPMTKLLADGLSTIDGDKWAKHRKIINPVFHVEKLKHMLPAFYVSCSEMLSKWEEIVLKGTSFELDVWPDLQIMASEVISRTAFGSSYEEGRTVFELQKEQAEYVIEKGRSIYIVSHFHVQNFLLRLPNLSVINYEKISTKEEVKLGELNLPAEMPLIIPTILVHYDKEIWGEDAKEFKPERFSEGVSKATKGQVSFIPFSWGPRVCIGQNFAMMEAKMAIAMILQRFSFELSPSYTHAPFAIVTIHPQYGAPLLMHKL